MLPRSCFLPANGHTIDRADSKSGMRLLPEYNSDPHLVQHAVQLIAGLTNAVAIVAVHHEDEALHDK